MSFYFKCDWCGADLKDRDRATLEVSVKRAGCRAETRPTLHFCVEGQLDYNRLGLPDIIDDGDSCYARATAMLRGGVATGDPGMGHEWRLMPVGAGPDDYGRPVDRRELERRASDPGGICDLRIALHTYSALWAAGVSTIDEVRDRLADGSIMNIRGIGATRAAELRRAVEASDAEVAR